MSKLSKEKMFWNFTSSLARWVRQGLKTVSKDEFIKRMEICSACEFWDGEARGGLGKCKKCGCASAKLVLATEKCPIDKWDATL